MERLQQKLTETLGRPYQEHIDELVASVMATRAREAQTLPQLLARRRHLTETINFIEAQIGTPPTKP